jgi:hypothetical protein
MKQIVLLTLALGFTVSPGCQNHVTSPESARLDSPAKSIPKSKLKNTPSKKIEDRRNEQINSTKIQPSEEAKKAVSSMNDMTILRVKLITETADCLFVNESNRKLVDKELESKLELHGMSSEEYSERFKYLIQHPFFRKSLSAAHNECRLPRAELLDILADRECVKKAYSKAGIAEVPRPLNRFRRHRGKAWSYLEYVERRYVNDATFQSELKASIEHCPDYDLKKLRNRQGEVCLQNEHCLAHLKCYKSSPMAGGGDCLTDSDIAARKQQAESYQKKNRACRTRPACKQEGACTFSAGKCLAQSNDCYSSDACKDEGRCAANAGICIVRKHWNCVRSKLCKQEGKCVHRNGECVIGTVKDCKESKECEKHGHCSLVNNRCVAGNKDDCYSSQNCKRFGQCTLEQGACVVGSNADCNGLRICERFGWCSRIVESFRIKGTNQNISEPARCGVANSADCKRSNHCKNEGRCTAKGTDCVK